MPEQKTVLYSEMERLNLWFVSNNLQKTIQILVFSLICGF